jgi:hypothetical protein
VFSSLAVRVTPWGPEAYDAPDGIGAPALLLEAAGPEGERTAVYVGVDGVIHADRDDLPPMRYIAPEPVGIDADPDSRVPGMEVEAEAAGERRRGFLMPSPDSGLARLRLGESGLYPALILARGDQAARQYESEVTIRGERLPAERVIIGVNRPARYGGYHIYQHSYDTAGQRYTILRVASDAGLPLVWTGYLLLGGGVCWVCWVLPGLRGLKGGGPHGC